MRLVTFNVNGLRARLHQVQAVIDKHSPDVIGLQEIKVDDSIFPREAIEEMGYHVAHHGQPGHYGVALLTKSEPVSVVKGLPNDDESAQKRLINATVESNLGAITVYNGYFPQGESRHHPTKFPAKERFYSDLTETLRTSHSPDEHIVIMGDMNITPTDVDIGIGEENRKRWLRDGKTSFLPEEREWLDSLCGLGFRDPYHDLKSEQQFSWFDYRSRGFERDPKRGLRIDYFLLSSPLIEAANRIEIDYEIRGSERPSDHCPVVLDLAS